MSGGNERRLVLVVGVGRSGTSLLAGILAQLGFHIPQPEVEADDTNPRGFGEPQWVVDFHEPLMYHARVKVFDSRPGAFDRTREAGADEKVHAMLRGWLSEQLAVADDVIVKDPRTGWFLELWQGVAAELGVATSFVTMLRHPAEILASAKRSYGTWQPDASRAVSWINEMLAMENETRGASRVFVRYEDLMADWSAQATRLGEVLDLSRLRNLDRSTFPQVESFIDPTLHRAKSGWDDLDVPPRVSDMAEALWAQLVLLASPDGDTAAVRGELDALRADYAAFYAEAEAIAQSSVTALDRRHWRKRAAQLPPGALNGSAAPATQRAQLARRVPERYRRRIRGVLRVLKRS